MIHHLAITAAVLERSTRFYDAVLGRLGYRRIIGTADLSAWDGPQPEILIYAAKPAQASERHRTYDPGIHHIAFEVADRTTVDDVTRAAVAAGGRLLDEPRVYPDYSPNYYAAFFEDPDGIKLEVMTS